MSSSSNPINPQNQGRSSQEQQPSLLAGHAEFIKGSAEVSGNTCINSRRRGSFPSSQQQQQQQPFNFPFAFSSPSMSCSPTTTSCNTPPSSSPPSTAALHQRNRELRKTRRIRDSRGQVADVMFAAHLSSTQSAIGSITGSHAWTTSGEQDKAHAKSSMKAAAEIRDSEGKGYGHVEEVAGKWTGCEGMKEEGKVSAERAKRRD